MWKFKPLFYAREKACDPQQRNLALALPHFFKSSRGEKWERHRQASFQNFRMRSSLNIMRDPPSHRNQTWKRVWDSGAQFGIKGFRSKAFPACLPVSVSIKGAEKSGLGEPFGKASLAKTAFGLGRFISMRDRSSWTGECGYRYPSEVWPDEA
jgi:hypothetical protein